MTTPDQLRATATARKADAATALDGIGPLLDQWFAADSVAEDAAHAAGGPHLREDHARTRAEATRALAELQYALSPANPHDRGPWASGNQ